MARGDAVERVLAKFERKKQSGSGFMVQCPAHEDKTPSLHVSQGTKGAVLKCFGGCSQDQIIERLGMKAEELFDDCEEDRVAPRPRSATATAPAREVVSLRTVAEKFALDADYLKSLGLRESGGAVLVPFRDEAGVEVHAKRRVRLTGKDKYRYPPGSHVMPYGLDRLPDTRRQKRPYLFFVEGESDCWVLWKHGLSALGMPGAASIRCLEAPHVEGIGEAFIVQEPGDAGMNFALGMGERLRKDLGFKGPIWVVRMSEQVKDPADLYKSSPDKFSVAWRKLCGAAVKLEEQDVDDMVFTMDTVERREVEFLWHPYIPLGKLTILAGIPGLGKSYASTAITSALTSGNALPGGVPAAPCNVLMFSAEDDPEEVLRPRLEDNGADLRRVIAYRMDQGFTFGDANFDRLELLIRRFEPRLIIFDPIVSFTGAKININKQNEVRSVLQPLINIARKHRVAILIVAHVSKGTVAEAIYSIMGSVDFSAAVRSALIAYPDPEKSHGEEGGVIAHAKHNLSKGGESLRYLIEGTRFYWRGTSRRSARDLANAARPDDEKNAMEEARKFLAGELAGGPRQAKEVLRDAQAVGVSSATLARARWALGVLTRKTGFQGGFEWYLPSPEERAEQDAAEGPKRPREDEERLAW